MKNILFLSFLTIILATTSCSTDANTPKDTAKNYIENLAHGNVDAAKKYVTTSSAKLLDFTKSFPISTNKDYKFIFIKDSVQNDTAWVRYKTIHNEDDMLTLIKENNEWKVSLGD